MDQLAEDRGPVIRRVRHRCRRWKARSWPTCGYVRCPAPRSTSITWRRPKTLFHAIRMTAPSAPRPWHRNARGSVQISQLPQSRRALTEITQQHAPATTGQCLGHRHHGVELVRLDPLLLGISVVVDQATRRDHVLRAVQQQRVGRQPSRRHARFPGSNPRCCVADRNATTKRTFRLSIPMPKATVATTTSHRPDRKLS